MSSPDPAAPRPSHRSDRAAREQAAYQEMSRSPEFAELRSRYRRFVIPASIAFLSWYALYIVLAMFAPDLMNTPVVGHINLALVIGLLQFGTTFALAFAYARYSTRRLDPVAAGLNQTFTSAGTAGER